MVEAYPFSPLVHGQALGIGLTSYQGWIYIGLTADRDALADVEAIVDALGTSLNELKDAAAKETGLRIIPGRADAS
jgi:hypothetical protein